MRSAILPPFLSMWMVRARTDFGAAGKGPSPRARESRTVCAPTSHQFGVAVNSCTIFSLQPRVSSEIAAARNTAGSSALSVSDIPDLVFPDSLALLIGDIARVGNGLFALGTSVMNHDC